VKSILYISLVRLRDDSHHLKPLKHKKMTVRKQITQVEFLKKVQSVKGYTPTTIVSSGYVMINGIPHKMVGGCLIPLTKISKS
jgi:hypothetical protein